jgi:hypothetical protein
MRTSLTLAVALLTSAAMAQSPYRPFAGAGATWVVATGGLHFGCNPLEGFMVDDQFQLGAEVTVDGFVYNELIRSSWGSWMAYGPPAGGPCPGQGIISQAPAVVGLLRQDIAARKVYSGPDSTDLLYDFSIGLGTYPQTVDNFIYPSLQVVALDSMELNDGYHRTWVLGIDEGNGLHDSAFCTVIEGIGSTYGPLPLTGIAPVFEFSNALSCFSTGTQVTYPLGGVDCGIAMGLPSLDHFAANTLSPNPTAASLRLNGVPSNARYTILDAFGRVVRTGALNGSQVDVNELSPAVYALRITDTSGATSSAVNFVKE